MNQLEKNLPSDNADKDFAEIVEFSKATIEGTGSFNPTLFTLSKQVGVMVSGGDIPEGQTAKEEMFNELGRAISSRVSDVEMFVMVTMANMQIGEIDAEMKDEIEKNGHYAPRSMARTIQAEEEVLVVSAKKRNGECKTNFFPLGYNGVDIVWKDLPKPIDKINTLSWSAHKRKHKGGDDFRNPMLEFIYNGYLFKQFCDGLENNGDKKGSI